MADTFTKPMSLLVNISQRNGTMLYIPAATGAILRQGTIVKYSADEVTHIDAAADNATVVGVCWGKSASGETDKVPIITEGIFRAVVGSATYQYGAGLKYDDTGDNGQLVADGNADTLCWAWEYGATVTSLKVYFSLMLLDAELWDTVS